VKQDYGKRVALIGNLSVDRLARAEPDEIAHETRALLEMCSRGGGYGFSSGNALARYIKYENVLAVSKTLREFNRTWS
jgi:uroporphyrinogen-III decarboxylase